MSGDKNEGLLKKITNYTDFKIKDMDNKKAPLKRTSSALSPEDKQSKIPKSSNIINQEMELKPAGADLDPSPNPARDEVNNKISRAPQLADIEGLKELLNPLINKVRSLKNIMEDNFSGLDKKYDKFEEAITTQREQSAHDLHKLEDIITHQKSEISKEVNV